MSLTWNRRQFLSATAMGATGLWLGSEARGESNIPEMTPNGIAKSQIPPNSSVIHPQVADEAPELTHPFPLHRVKLLPSPFLAALETNRQYLMSLPNDRLAHMFRITAGLGSQAQPFGGWENPKCELRGHFTGGHYLSAAAHMHATTGDEAIQAKAGELVRTLAACQQAHGNGYLSAFPQGLFDRLREGKPVWAPFYTLHKIMAGLIDMQQHCGNAQALETAEKLAGWIGAWVGPISDAQMGRILNVEYGGMNEALYNLYSITGNRFYAAIAHRFDHKEFFDPLSEFRDELKGLHANTHVPQVIGAARRYELTGETYYRNVAQYFWQEVTAHRCYATGGTSNGEWWTTPPGVLAKQLGSRNQECCVQYNMLKLTRHIHSWTADARAMDYYERTLYNSKLGTQQQTGMKMYFVPLQPGFWTFYHSPDDSFWCCSGTGAEDFSKFNNSIYSSRGDHLYINLYIPSLLEWPEAGLQLRQLTQYPLEESTDFELRLRQPREFTINLRVPWWADRGGELTINGKRLPALASPGSYLALRRVWQSGDRVSLRLPMHLHTAHMPDDERVQAAMYGPLVLAAELPTDGLTRNMMYGKYRNWETGKPTPEPEMVAPAGEITRALEPIPGTPLHFRTQGQKVPLRFIPLYQIRKQRYGVYWKVARA